MKIILLVLALAPTLAAAEPLPAQNIANMVAQSDAVMGAGLCAVANDAKSRKGETMTVLLPPPVGARTILREDYDWIRGAGYTKNKRTGRFLMSERIEAACKKDALSGRCIAARSYWSQQPLAVRAPGNGVVSK